jgi:hypothetical protein
VAGSKSMAMAPGMFEGSMRKLASKNRAYYARQSASVDFNEEDRAESGENDVLRRKGK